MYVVELTLPDGRKARSHHFQPYQEWKNVVGGTFNDAMPTRSWKFTGQRMTGHLLFVLGFRPLNGSRVHGIEPGDILVQAKIVWEHQEL